MRKLRPREATCPKSSSCKWQNKNSNLGLSKAYSFVTILVHWFELRNSQEFVMVPTVTEVLNYRNLKFDRRQTALASKFILLAL